MSYSFCVVATNKAEALSLVSVELDRVIAAQPAHAADRAAAQAHAETMIGLLRDDPDMDVRVSVFGSIVAPTTGITQVSTGADAMLWPRETVAAS